jgi:hypothetical protein
MNEFLTKLCLFLKDFPENQVAIPWDDGELYLSYIGPPSHDPDEIEYRDVSPVPSEGLRVPNCEHKGRSNTAPPSGGAWVDAATVAAELGITYQKVGRLGKAGKILRERRGNKYVYWRGGN